MNPAVTRSANDSALKADVIDGLRLETFLDRDRMGVEVSGGVVFLTGYVDSFAEKTAADRAARHAAGPAALVVGARIKRLDSRHRAEASSPANEGALTRQAMAGSAIELSREVRPSFDS